MKRVSVSVVCLFLCACATSGYQKFYKAFPGSERLNEIRTLNMGEKPDIYASEDLQRDTNILESKGFLAIGYSSFNGQSESDELLSAQAQRVGAVMVLVKQTFTGTHSEVFPLFVPDSTTTMSSGSIVGYGGSATYQGTSTTYGRTVLPITIEERRYDQTAVFFVKSLRKLKIGIRLGDLSPMQRKQYERNTGAVILNVLEGSPAFNANVLPDDILIEIGGVAVKTKAHASELLRSADPPDGKLMLKVIRVWTEKEIVLELTQE